MNVAVRASQTATTNGVVAWRYWRIDGARLQSPLTGDPLPATGQLIAACHRPHLPPHPACQCGVSLYRDPADLRRVLDMLDPQQFVATVGHAETPVIPDPVGQLYRLGATSTVWPAAHRTRTYAVTMIYTETPVTLDYALPVTESWDEFVESAT
ncbi:hypothetical protein HZU38_18900 [Mycolicibacterium vanbaalenii]|uniref:hypothetical protein n=1 Tax=Mycolicibacterium vanbaalenii TaxID=110539 RepID=UPI001F39A90B|nr:hypothetical protein [Mycolicibacterium vanbaalenii]UJL27012.1 hypothetical protein HZU38_18900 [Mycolicibacterium vanbaalenii]WND59135.1 hypothetical protein QQA43_12505 [Mycolicibacterium vanbaalenii]